MTISHLFYRKLNGNTSRYIAFFVRFGKLKSVECGLTVAINSTQILKPTQGHKKGTYSDIDPDHVQVNCR